METSEELKADIKDAIKDVATPWVDIYRQLAPEEFDNMNAPVSDDEPVPAAPKDAVKAPSHFWRVILRKVRTN